MLKLANWSSHKNSRERAAKNQVTLCTDKKSKKKKTEVENATTKKKLNKSKRSNQSQRPYGLSTIKIIIIVIIFFFSRATLWSLKRFTECKLVSHAVLLAVAVDKHCVE